ncbi:hypothetical protein F5X68DRAFT_240827 [Plectosphaerella plurivora]|uniref:FR47-like domain-containing protein n=1 Tax=Plectosphaerella plurivora TaxID=936078 RepID=A0A9P8VB35_9PEZI|nr:hypothetical protein F5X68DRAFT_240827 [Plectosphaerella plurivora]
MTSDPYPVQVFNDVPPGLLRLLQAHLPRSITLLRRLQFTTFPNGKTDVGRIVVASDVPLPEIDTPGQGVPTTRHFAATYIDPSRGLETNMWFYSTYEDSHGFITAAPPLSPEDNTLCRRQIMAVLNEARRQGRDYPVQPLPAPDHILVGSLNNCIRDVARENGIRFGARPGAEYEKFIFNVDDLPEQRSLPDGMVWADAGPGDCELAKSRTSIPRTVKLLQTLPSQFIKLEDGTPVAWAFLGVDGSFSGVHCEEPFRKRGLAKAVGAKLIREKTSAYGQDSYSAADVAPENVSSQAMCRSLGGKVHWAGSWSLINIRD